MNNKRQETGD